MKTPPIPSNEGDRIKALREYQILDTVPEQVYDDITKIASSICGTPIALVSLVDKDRQWFKSNHGLAVRETPREFAYCAHAINEPTKILEVSDAFQDERFHDNPLATGDPFVRFYAGAPLTDANGNTLGTLCVIDHEERHLSEEQKASLWALSRQVVALLESRKEKLEKEKNEQDFYTLLENLDDGVFEVDENAFCTYANNKMLQMLERSLEEVLSTSIWDMIYHEDVAEMQAFYVNKFKEKAAKCRYEYRIRPKKGKPIWIAQNTTMKYKGDRMVKLRSISRDISETKAIQEELALKESLYQLVSENSTDLIALHDLNGVYKFVSPSACEILGYEPEELVGTDPYKLIHPSDIERLQSGPHRKTLDGTKVESVEYRLRKKSGEYVWMQSYTTPILNENNEVISFQTSSREITGRKTEEIKLIKHLGGLTLINELASNNDSDKLLTEALDKISRYLNMDIGVISKIESNEFSTQHFYSKELKLDVHSKPKIDGTIVNEVFHDERVLMTDNKISIKTRHPLFPETTDVQYIGACVKKNGVKYGTVDFISFDLNTTFNSYDREFIMLLANWIGSILVSQEEKEQLRRARIHAEAASEAKASFLSMMSHEIRTPLNGIIGSTHLLLTKSPTEIQMPHLKVLEQSSNNLMSIVNDILDFGKIEEGKIQLDNSTFNLHELISGIYDNYKIQGEEKGIQVTQTYDESLADYYTGDAVRISQILHNLLNNAVKFTEQGQVSLSLEKTNSHNSYDEIAFKIKDSGVGIPKDKHKEIFEVFTQADKTTTRKFGGSGLGLSITKKLLNLMSSDVELESVEGLGSLFSFRLVLPQSSSDQMDQKDVSGPKALNATVLLVEDNVFNRAIAKDFLHSWECSVLEAENGKEALELLQSQQVDIVLLDLQMPVMDGYETIHHIREKSPDNIKDIPVAALTAAAMGDIESKVYKSGMDGFITKPFHPNDFYQKISELLNKRIPEVSSDIRTVVIQKLKETLGSDDVENYLEVFKQTIVEGIDVLQAAIRGKNLPASRAYAHKNKSSLKLGGLMELANEAEELEELISKDGEEKRILEKATKHLESLKETLTSLNHE